MLLTVDIGNTQTALGLFDGSTLVQSWRMPTDTTFTADELQVRLHGYFEMYGLHLSCVDAIALAGVVPQLAGEWREAAQHISLNYVSIGRATAKVTKIRAPKPEEVGADRIANATAAAELYGAPSIVVDFGTATNIDVVDAEGYYIGGAISPGLRISMDALTARAAKLVSVPLTAPATAIGHDTFTAVQSGTVLGAAAMAEGLIARIQSELAPCETRAKIIATGGLADVVVQCTDVFDVVDKQLTLKGIQIIYQRMQA